MLDTGEPLCRALFDKMIAAKNYQAGMADPAPDRVCAVRHAAAPSTSPGDVMPAGARVREVAVLQPAGLQPHGPHLQPYLRRGCYAAGYYSYKWAEVLSADAYTPPSRKPPAPTVCPAWRPAAATAEAILEAGGSRPAMESFKAFRAGAHAGCPAAPPGHGLIKRS